MGVPTARAEAGSAKFRVVSFNIWFRNHDYARHRALSREDARRRHRAGRARSRRRRAADRRIACRPIRIRSTRRLRHGAIVFSRWPIVSAESLPLAESPGVRAARVTLDWHGTPVTVLGVHLHWPLGPRNSRLRNEELAGIASFAAAHQEPLLVAGDFNVDAVVAAFPCGARAFGAERLRRRPRPRAVMAVAIPAARHPHRSLLASRHWRSVDVRLGPSHGSDHLPLIADLAARCDAAAVTSAASRAWRAG